MRIVKKKLYDFFKTLFTVKYSWWNRFFSSVAALDKTLLCKWNELDRRRNKQSAAVIENLR